MTYLFKLVRRLAVSRDSAMVPLLALLVACGADSTAPDGEAATPANTPVSFDISPRSVTIETSQRIQFRGQTRTSKGDRAPSSVAWRASGGTINPDGTFSSATAGTFRVVARGRGWRQTASAVVIVVHPQPGVVRLAVAPESVTLEAGAAHGFAATAYLKDGSAAPIGVTWAATGGTINGAGEYVADSVAGTYRVIAATTTGALSDTAEITVVSPPTAGSPTPPAPPPSGTPEHPTTGKRVLGQVFVIPGRVSLVAGATRQYRAFGRTTGGDSVAVAVTFSVTGGTVTSNGLYTAGSKPGRFKIVAKEKATGMADTTTVTVTAAPPPAPVPPVAPSPIPGTENPPAAGRDGIPFGPFDLFGRAGPSAQSAGSNPFTLTMDSYSPTNIIPRINNARARGLRLMVAMASGAHSNYKTDGVFDMSKWQAKMDSYNTPAIKAAVASAVADGTIIGNEVMDEPHNTYGANSWGPRGTMTKARVDQMCAYVKNIFPNLPVGVTHDHTVLEPSKSYRVCDFLIDQYAWWKTKGDINKFRDAGLAMGRRDGMAIAFSLNVLDGGMTNGRSCPVPETGGPGIMYSAYAACRMTAEQVRQWGKALGSAGCALFMWRYDDDYFSRPENVAAFRDVAESLANVPAKACRQR